ncbi:MAG: hypothetical protein K2M47_01355 [Clostridiales bacterium]|nr:hypothetical protein [Clostridiales bacterium]
MDDKYEGCNIVESVVTASRLPEQKDGKKRTDGTFKSHFILRLLISAIIIGVILVLHYFPSLPLASGVSSVLKRVFCYDVFGRGAFGVSLFG